MNLMALNLKEQTKLRYAILKSIADGKTDLHEEDFDVTEGDFGNAIDAIGGSKLKYLDGGDIYFGRFDAADATITEKGEKFLYDNSRWGKALKLAKTIGDFIHRWKP